MTTDAKEKENAGFLTAKIRLALKRILPRGKSFRLHVADSGINKMKIVRIVTPAWRSLSAAERIGKLLEALNGSLTKPEQESILRFSVLTPDEYKEVVPRRALPQKRNLT